MAWIKIRYPKTGWLIHVKTKTNRICGLVGLKFWLIPRFAHQVHLSLSVFLGINPGILPTILADQNLQQTTLFNENPDCLWINLPHTSRLLNLAVTVSKPTIDSGKRT